MALWISSQKTSYTVGGAKSLLAEGGSVKNRWVPCFPWVTVPGFRRDRAFAVGSAEGTKGVTSSYSALRKA